MLYKNNQIPKKRLLNVLFCIWTNFFSLQLFSSYSWSLLFARRRLYFKTAGRVLPHSPTLAAEGFGILPGPPQPVVVPGAAVGCRKQPLCPWRRAFRPIPDTPSWSILVQSNTNFSTALSGVNSKLLEKKGK